MHEIAFLLQHFDAQRGAIMIFAIIAVACVISVVIVILPFWFICKKAGFSPWLSLLFLIPFGGLVLVYVLAFAEWKVLPLNQTTALPQAYPPQPPLPPRA